MNSLLKFEFRKLKRQKSFYITLIIMAAMLLITGITYKIILSMPEISEAAATTGETIPLNFSDFVLGFTSASMQSVQYLRKYFVYSSNSNTYGSML